LFIQYEFDFYSLVCDKTVCCNTTTINCRSNESLLTITNAIFVNAGDERDG